MCGSPRLPDEIIYEVLVRLPTNSLLKCRAVCKSWNSLVKSSAFILTHLKSTLSIQSNNKGDLLLLHAGRNKTGPRGGDLFLLGFDNIEDEYTKRRAIPTSGMGAVSSIYGGREINLDRPSLWKQVKTCNGLICLVISLDKENRVLVPILWNPCVRKYLILPSPSFSPYKCCYVASEFGYDSHTNDYKIVHIKVPKHQCKQTPCTFEVFSLLGGSWKNHNPPADFIPDINDLKSVEVNGALHWICGQPFTEFNESTVIVTFDLSTELFGKMKIPEALKNDSPHSCNKLRYRKSFALLCDRRRPEKDVLDLWVMSEYGAADSWTKLLTIQIPGSLDYLPNEPKYFRKSGQVILGTFLHGVQSLDPKSKQVKVLVDDRLYLLSIDPFVESLVLLDRSDAFSY